MNGTPFLKVENLVKKFPIHGGLFGLPVADVHAVSDVSFELKKGETLGLVGESGCGKSTLGRCIIKLLDPTSGKITFKGEDITHVKGDHWRELRKKMQIIFQDPFASLNPKMSIKEILQEPLVIHKLFKTENAMNDRVHELAELVGLRPEFLSRFPHEFSGGQRQRVGIARALAVEPELIICDEPVSALDVSIQAQVINLLMDLQKRFGLSYIFIAHDLKVVEHVSHEVAVMYLGKIVEQAKSEQIYLSPQHPYTRALLSAIPVSDPDKKNRDRIILTGDVPSPINPPSGCHFHPRCPIVTEHCKTVVPKLEEKRPAHIAACLNV